MGKIIAIAGANGSGKDTVGRIIQYLQSASCKMGVPFKDWDLGTAPDGMPHDQFLGKFISISNIVKFGNSTSKAFAEITGKSYHLVPRDEKETLRTLYIKFAETCKTIFGDSVWVDSLFKDYYEGCNWIITDLRFPVEYNKVKSLDSIFLTVKREGVSEGVNLLKDSHFDFTIYNDGSIEDLIEKIKNLGIV